VSGLWSGLCRSSKGFFEMGLLLLVFFAGLGPLAGQGLPALDVRHDAGVGRPGGRQSTVRAGKDLVSLARKHIWFLVRTGSRVQINFSTKRGPKTSCAHFLFVIFCVQMDAESSASLEAFARLAPGIPLVADSVTVHALFELLTEETNGRLPFATYNKYLTELEK